MTEREWLLAALHDMGDDEVSVLATIAQRLVKGARQYGPLALASDRRDWMQEASEEFADAAVYLSMMMLCRTKRKAVG